MKLGIEPTWSIATDSAAPPGAGLSALARLLLDLVARDRQPGTGGPPEPAGHGVGQTGEPEQSVRTLRLARGRRRRVKVEGHC